MKGAATALWGAAGGHVSSFGVQCEVAAVMMFCKARQGGVFLHQFCAINRFFV